MTPEQLDEARAREAWDVAQAKYILPFELLMPHTKAALVRAARLAREGWTPTDPLVLKARKIVAEVWLSKGNHHLAERCMAGVKDDTSAVKAVIIALRSTGDA